MNIPMNRILDKMSNELAKAKQEQSEVRIREHLIVMRTLCDLVLEEKQDLNERTYSNNELNLVEKKMMSTPSRVDDDGNGDSLLDF
ncbi:YwdI family protein [Litchfieldia salsa]|uniref:YwdI family protein n=1 Tax=Litchfieldia salsa TaxID=930152 RepID=A0A1H0U8C7_9BACI|nr:YwdI family protein [Litchfieldia salsa]SDP62076.1 hypothetical protein SAMN05216565_104201 [Litchfieldia salsa]